MVGLLMKIANEKDNNKSVRSGLISTPVRFLDTQGDTSMSTAILAVHFFSTPNDFQFPFSVLQKRKADKETEFAKRSLGLF